MYFKYVYGWVFYKSERPVKRVGGGSRVVDEGLLNGTDRCPKSSVDLVSDSLYEAGDEQMTMTVRAFPPRDSCKILVSLLSRYGMCFCYIEN